MGQYHKIVNLTKKEYLTSWDFAEGAKMMEFGQDCWGVMYAFGLLLRGDWKGDRIAIAGDYGKPGDIPSGILAECDIELGSSTLYRVAQDIAEVEAKGENPVSYFTDHEGVVDEIALQNATHFVNAAKKGRRALYRTGTVTKVDAANNHLARSWQPNEEALDLSYPAHYVIHNLDKNEILDPLGFGDAPSLFGMLALGGDGGITTALAVLLASACKGGARGGGDIHSDSELVGSWAGDRIAVVLHDETTKAATDISASVRELIEEGHAGKYRVRPDGTVARQLEYYDLQTNELVNRWYDGTEI